MSELFEINSTSDLFEMMKNMTMAYASMIYKNTGCSTCNELPGNEICLDHQIEQADADVLKAMNRLEELKQKKEQHELSSNKSD